MLVRVVGRLDVGENVCYLGLSDCCGTVVLWLCVGD